MLVMSIRLSNSATRPNSPHDNRKLGLQSGRTGRTCKKRCCTNNFTQPWLPTIHPAVTHLLSEPQHHRKSLIPNLTHHKTYPVSPLAALNTGIRRKPYLQHLRWKKNDVYDSTQVRRRKSILRTPSSLDNDLSTNLTIYPLKQTTSPPSTRPPAVNPTHPFSPYLFRRRGVASFIWIYWTAFEGTGGWARHEGEDGGWRKVDRKDCWGERKDPVQLFW